jgi:hypothetical protein
LNASVCGATLETNPKKIQMDAPKKGSKALFYLGLFAMAVAAVVAGNKITEQLNKPKIAAPASTSSTSTVAK